jgi:flagellar basal-body rod modification protein FlgD
MTISGLSQVSSQGGQVGSGAKQDVMGKDDFLHLLVTQLKAQDPLNPMDSTAFTAQLAQFSSLEQLQNINSTLGTLNASQAESNNSQAVQFIGKTITAVGDSLEVRNGQSEDLHFSLNDPAAALYVRIYDERGNYIRQIESGMTEAGPNSVSWDGRDYLGGKAPDGNYTYEVSAVDELGNSVSSTLFTSGLVTGVQFKNGLAYLECGSRQIPLGNVVRVESGG